MPDVVDQVLRNQQAYVVVLDSEQAVKAVEYDTQ